jgi:hypothetical protein
VLALAACSSSDGASTASTLDATTITTSSDAPPTSTVGGPADDAAFAAWFESRPGTAERRCVDVDQLHLQQQWSQLVSTSGTPITEQGRPLLVLDVRSGGLVAGNFADLSGAVGKPGDADFALKIYWDALDTQLANREPLTVTISDLHGSLADTTSTFEGAWQVRADGVNSYFWPSGIALPEAGRWRITAHASEVWGCFELTV